MSKEKKLIPELRFPEFVAEPVWKQKMLGDDDVSKILRGGSPRPITDYLTKNQEGLNWLKIGDVDKESKYVLKTEEKVLPAALSKTREVFPGDLIMSNSMSFGRPYILKIQTCIHDGWIAVTEINEGVDTAFLYYLILADGSQRYFLNSAAGGGIKNLNAEIIKKLPIAIPPILYEQKKIASCLASIDDLIEAHNQKLEALKDHKKGLMQNLFPQEDEKVPKFRFPEFENEGEWKRKSFDELFKIGNGRDYKHLGKGEIPVYGSGGYMLSVDDYLYDGESACIGRKGTINKPIFLTGKFWTVDTLFYTHSFKECLPKFVYYIFQNINWIVHNEAGGVPSLSKTNISKIETLVPEPNEQKRILYMLSGLDELISIQINKIEQLKEHKKGLMQVLFPNNES